ncbi:MAG TPA: Gfo/Idh/MocA family oxidoreductase [Saprospiraceae bacterium]|nr:Gfo/Idh/MocA family oxidoreductase [Saprospiraceae bacterium]MCB9327746.1 Gfo/Idh/MocA family oxidoreductase [Lewinellaceae bacterium]HPK08721.1 Gfo/Idh/MocA family oxidoreductase [Saprospiraceae bacterium]HPQ21197.1 Gfo/Idh/MocA family oxidoreductase [Saprospiraceae bacterium]HRX29120.1 Gfo/Idh/MocA family oxidoreductase [Saprospiraceae bacterium]
MIKIGLVGLGHLGKIHLKCLKNTEFEIVGISDLDVVNGKKIAQENEVQFFESYEELLSLVDAIDIVTPTNTHASLASEAIAAGKHVFIEKPITNNTHEALSLCINAESKGLKIQVGHVERYNPAFLATQDRFANPKFIEGHRLAIYNPRGTDVSVVLDLMIHDLDLVLSLVRSPVAEVHSNAVSILSNTPDICNARITFENGCVANLTASRMSMKNMRKLRVFSEDSYVSIDFLEKESQIIKMENAADGEEGLIIDSPKGKKKLLLESPKVTQNNAIVEELSDFYESIINDKPTKVSGRNGYEALRLAEQIEKINQAFLDKYN